MFFYHPPTPTTTTYSYSLFSFLWFLNCFYCITLSLSLHLYLFHLSAQHTSIPLVYIPSSLHGYSPVCFLLLLSPPSSPSDPSVHGHMLLCRWVPVSVWLPLVTVCCTRRGFVQLCESTTDWAELWGGSLPEAENQWLWTNDSRQQRAKHCGLSVSFRIAWDSEGWRRRERDQMKSRIHSGKLK